MSNLDLECLQTNPYTPMFPPILTHYLNQMLAALPDETVTLSPRQQLCAPAQKNAAVPPPGVIDFVRYVSLSCHTIQGLNVNRQLNLTQLNSVLLTLPLRRGQVMDLEGQLVLAQVVEELVGRAPRLAGCDSRAWPNSARTWSWRVCEVAPLVSMTWIVAGRCRSRGALVLGEHREGAGDIHAVDGAVLDQFESEVWAESEDELVKVARFITSRTYW